MNTIKGENLMIFVKEGDLYGNASTNLIALAHAKSCSFGFSVDEFDTTSKDTGSWKASVPGMKSWTMSSDNLYTPDYDKLLALALARTTLTLYWIPSSNSESGNVVTHTPTLSEGGNSYKYYYGTAWINNINANADNDDNANYSISFTGTGPLTQSNSLPSSGIGVDRDVLSLVQGDTTKVDVLGATGTVTATTSNAKVTASVSNGVVTVTIAADCPAGAYTVTLNDSGTSSKNYIFISVAAS